MSDADWPAPEPAAPRDPDRRPAPLPRIEDLPIAEQGYDREQVREAFDAFYRHAAQLDATLSTLEAVETFQRTSAELRAELRTIRGSGWTVQSWQAGSGYGARGRVSEWSLPPAFPRVAGEALFLIVMGVIVGVAGWSRLTIVLVMALALGVVWLIEWVAARERTIPRAAKPVVVPDLDEEPAELPAGEAAAPPGAQDDGPEAMTMLGAPPARVSEAPAAAVEEADAPEEPAEPGADDTEERVVAVAEAEPEPVAEAEPEPVAEAEPEPVAEAEPELVAAAEPVDDEVLDGAREVEDALPEEPRSRLDPWEEPAAVPDEPVEEPVTEERGTVEARADQTPVPLERSRTRRRSLRRARRR